MKRSIADRRIKEIVEGIQGLALKALRSYAPQAQAVMASGCTDKECIEMLLDGMLDFCWDKEMLEWYRKLCRHYYGIDQQAAVGYVYAYRDMWDNERTRRPMHATPAGFKP